MTSPTSVSVTPRSCLLTRPACLSRKWRLTIAHLLAPRWRTLTSRRSRSRIWPQVTPSTASTGMDQAGPQRPTHTLTRCARLTDKGSPRPNLSTRSNSAETTAVSTESKPCTTSRISTHTMPTWMVASLSEQLWCKESKLRIYS